MKRILIVDDEKTVLDSLSMILQSDMVQIHAADALEKAEKLLQDYTFDVVITDLRLTGMLGEEGLEILRYIKEFKADTRVILITGYGNPEIMSKAYAMGVDYYLEKPVSHDIIRGALRTLGI